MAATTKVMPTVRRPPSSLEDWVHGGTPPAPATELVCLADLDRSAQVRVKGLSEERVRRYMEMLDASEPPPLKVRRDPGTGRLRLGDGGHRDEAARRKGRTHLPALIKPGSWLDAYRDGLATNGAHGLDLSKQDRAAALDKLLMSKEFKAGDLTQGQIAKDLGYTSARVSQRAAALVAAGSTVKPLTVSGADGRTQQRKNLGARTDLSRSTVKRLTVREADGQSDRALPARAAEPAPAPPPKEPLPPPGSTRPLRPRPRPPITAADLVAGLQLAQELRRERRIDDYALLLRLLRVAAAAAGLQLAQVSSADSEGLREGRTAEIAGALGLVVAVVPAIGGDTRFVLTRAPGEAAEEEAHGVT